MTKLLIGAGVVLGIVLAVIVGSRLSDEALAVVIGAICGIGASIPVSIALVIGATETRAQRATRNETSVPVKVMCEHGIDVSRAMCFACAQRGRYSLPVGMTNFKEIGDGKP